MSFKYEGLSQKEVKNRLKSGQVNIAKNESSKTYGQIFASNLLTFFNLINIFLFILVLSVGSQLLCCSRFEIVFSLLLLQ